METLRIELLQTRYGRRMGIKQWFAPRQVDGTIPLGDQVFGVLRHSRLLVVMLSEAYLESPWCRDERCALFDAIPGGVNADGRVILVDLGSVEHDESPAELHSLPGFRFFRVVDGQERRVLGYPVPSVREDREFYFGVRALAQRIGDRLETLRPNFARTGRRFLKPARVPHRSQSRLSRPRSIWPSRATTSPGNTKKSRPICVPMASESCLTRHCQAASANVSRKSTGRSPRRVCLRNYSVLFREKAARERRLRGVTATSPRLRSSARTGVENHAMAGPDGRCCTRAAGPIPRRHRRSRNLARSAGNLQG